MRSVTREDCKRFFDQTDTHLDAWVKQDEELQQFVSFAEMIKSPGLAYKTQTMETPEDNEHSEDEDDGEESD